MPKVLLKMSADWADEFQCEQFKICESQMEASQIIAECVNKGGYFGTNEGFEENDLSERNFSLHDLSHEEARFLERTLGNTFGTGILDNDFNDDEEE
jgi:hypothetical protein